MKYSINITEGVLCITAECKGVAVKTKYLGTYLQRIEPSDEDNSLPNKTLNDSPELAARVRKFRDNVHKLEKFLEFFPDWLYKNFVASRIIIIRYNWIDKSIEVSIKAYKDFDVKFVVSERSGSLFRLDKDGVIVNPLVPEETDILMCTPYSIEALEQLEDILNYNF